MNEYCFGRIVGDVKTLKEFCVELEKAHKKITAVATSASPLAQNTDEWDELLEAGFPCCHISPCPPLDCFWVPPAENWDPDVHIVDLFDQPIGLNRLTRFLEILDGGHGGVRLNYSHSIYTSHDEEYADLIVGLSRNEKEKCWNVNVYPRLSEKGVPHIDVLVDWYTKALLPMTGLDPKKGSGLFDASQQRQVPFTIAEDGLIPTAVAS